jgi:methylenetetrahydrofolate--tRNA-(uracil-5-)-methyltransferase
MVGFQTNLRFPEQKRVFGMIPGLENADFLRYGQMHRNTFLNAPALLQPTLQFKTREDLFFAGQITGVEGYAGNIATGVLAGINAARYLAGQSLLVLPVDTMLGALCHYICHASSRDFQPMKANFGLLPALELGGARTGKQERGALHAKRSMSSLSAYLNGPAKTQDRIETESGGPANPAQTPV